jgi:transposase
LASRPKGRTQTEGVQNSADRNRNYRQLTKQLIKLPTDIAYYASSQEEYERKSYRSTYEKLEKFTKSVRQKKLKGRYHLGDLDVTGLIILKWISKK